MVGLNTPLDETAVPLHVPPDGLKPVKVKFPLLEHILSILFPALTVGKLNTVKLRDAESVPHSLVAFATTVKLPAVV